MNKVKYLLLYCLEHIQFATTIDKIINKLKLFQQLDVYRTLWKNHKLSDC